jgi:hypothetical protein
MLIHIHIYVQDRREGSSHAQARALALMDQRPHRMWLFEITYATARLWWWISRD